MNIRLRSRNLVWLIMRTWLDLRPGDESVIDAEQKKGRHDLPFFFFLPFPDPLLSFFIWLTGSIATRPFPLKIFFLKPWRFNEKHFHILFTKRITLEFMTRLVYQWEANTSQSITEKCFITFQVNGVLDEWFTSRNKINCYNLFHLQNLQRLEVTYLSFIGPPLIVKIVHSLPHLRSLNLRMTPTTDEVKSLLSQSFAQEAHDIL